MWTVMYKTQRFCLAVLLFFQCTNLVLAQEYAIGADLSFMKQTEDRGFTFKDDGKSKPGIVIFKEHGYNWIRLRLFHSPTQLPNNLNYTIAFAKKAKEQGLKF